MKIDLTRMTKDENSRNLKTTVLYRKGGAWLPIEVDRLLHGLMTEACQHPKFPEYVILFGHHTKEATLEALLGGIAYTATQVTGADSKELPFRAFL